MGHSHNIETVVEGDDEEKGAVFSSDGPPRRHSGNISKIFRLDGTHPKDKAARSRIALERRKENEDVENC